MLIMKDYSEEDQLNIEHHHPHPPHHPQHRQQPLFDPQKLNVSTPTTLFSSKNIFLLFLCLFIGSLNFLFLQVNWQGQALSSLALYQNQNYNTSPGTTTQQSSLLGRFPKIFWIYTENEFGTESVNEQIYLELFNETAAKAGFEVRFANSWNSYDWLSAQTTNKITKTMQNSKVDERIHNILKLALLMQNGGILINEIDIVLLGDNLDWVRDMFEYEGSDYQKKYQCDPRNSYVFMQRAARKGAEMRYFDNFIAAVPGSTLLRQTFQLLSSFIVQGTLPCASPDIIKTNPDTKVNFLINSLEQILNCILQNHRNANPAQPTLCSQYGIQQPNTPNSVDYAKLDYADKRRLLLATDPETQFSKAFNLPVVNYVRGVNSGPIIDIVNSLLRSQFESTKEPIQEVKPGSLAFRILNATGNRQIFIDTLPHRQINFCIVILNQLADETEFEQAERLAIAQTYAQWKQVMFAKNVETPPVAHDPRVTILQSSSNQVRNIEVAVTRHCDPRGYALLLHSDQKMSDLNFLQDLAKLLQPRDTLGAFIHLWHNNRLIQAHEQLGHFHRGQEAIVNPNTQKLQSIINHMRVFAIESFRYIPQFDLRDIHGKYFSDRLIFLMTLLEMIRSEIHQPRMLYLMKKYSSVWNVPRKMAILQSAAIRVKRLQEVDEKQLRDTRSRLECEEVYQSMKNVLKWKIPFSKTLAFNNGDEFTPVDQRTGPELIPKVIHQVWLGTNKLPPAKEYFLRKTQLMYPNYKVKLWREENITRQNFPLTYELILNLLNFSKHSPYNKLATVTDIMRHEILAIEGGFWKDAGMNLLRPVFDKFTRYKLVIPVDKTFRYRWLQGMCFFANMPGLEHMLRINNYRNLNRMRIYDSYASSIAGPIDFRQLLVGQEEYDPDVLTMPYDTFYPAQVTEHPLKDLCTKREEELSEGDGVEIVQNGWYLLSDCDKLYPFSFAVQHNRFGDSWAKRRPV